MSVTDRLKQIAADKAAREAQKPPAETAPEVPANLMVPTDQRLAQAVQNAGQLSADPQKPAEMPQAAWDALPEDVKRLVAAGPAAQAKPVNPPEAQAGLVASATASATGQTPETTSPVVVPPAAEPPTESKKRGRKPKADAAPIDMSALVTEIQGLRVAVEQISEAILGVAELLVQK